MKYNDKFEGLAQLIGNEEFLEDKKGEYVLKSATFKSIEDIKNKFLTLLDIDNLDNDFRRVHELKKVLKFYNHNFIEQEYNDGTKKVAFYPGINKLDKINLIELIERSGFLGKKDDYGIDEDFISKDFLENTLGISEIYFEYALEVENIKKILNKDISSIGQRNYFKDFPYIEAEYEYIPKYWGGNDYDTVTYGEKSIGTKKILMLPKVFGSVNYGPINDLTMNYNQMTGIYSKPTDGQINKIVDMLEGHGFIFKGIKQMNWFDNQGE